jgi:exodeoxyribonuclease VIII
MIDLNQRPLSFSSLSQFDISPVHYIKYITKKREATPQMMLGSLVHSMLLEPDLLDDEYVIAPKFDMRKASDKGKKEEFEKANEGKNVVDQETWDTATAIADSVMEYGLANRILGMLNTREVHFKFEHSGLPINGYIDGIGTNAEKQTPFIFELKTSITASPSEVIKDFFNKKYYIQAAIYREALRRMGISESSPLVYIVVENKAPHVVSTFLAEESYMRYGEKEFNRLVNEFKSWMDGGFKTAGYSKDGNEHMFGLGLPAWVRE